MSKPLILLAEDEEANTIYMSYILSRLDTEVVYASTGREAINFCMANPEISLVLMDIRMPELDGLEATRQIRAFRPDLPIVALTAFGFHWNKAEVFEAGCTTYLSKPVTMSQIKSLLDTYINF